MPKKRSWSDEQLIVAVAESFSVRSVLMKLNLVPAGGNYEQVKSRIVSLAIDTEHFKGMGWNKGMTYHTSTRIDTANLLTLDSGVQSYKLKKRLFEEGIKKRECEMCGWAQMSDDGRVPLELDHINGNRYDNRIENLRILCPNCHSLQPTHRGRNKKVGLYYKS